MMKFTTFLMGRSLYVATIFFNTQDWAILTLGTSLLRGMMSLGWEFPRVNLFCFDQLQSWKSLMPYISQSIVWKCKRMQIYGHFNLILAFHSQVSLNIIFIDLMIVWIIPEVYIRACWAHLKSILNSYDKCWVYSKLSFSKYCDMILYCLTLGKAYFILCEEGTWYCL